MEVMSTIGGQKLRRELGKNRPFLAAQPRFTELFAYINVPIYGSNNTIMLIRKEACVYGLTKHISTGP